MARQGSSTYLDHLARSLVAGGAEVHLRILQPPRRDQLRLRLEPGFLDAYASVALHGARRRGADFYARDPRNWLGRLGRRDSPPTGPWALVRPEPAAAAWAAAEVARLAPDWVIANYFNAAEAFAALPPGPSKAILLHDVFALRAESLAALGRPPDFDPGMIARESAAFRTADLVLAIKPEEAAHVAAIAPGTAVATLPFAVDIPATDLAAPRPPLALFVGAVNPPNIDALDWLLAEIWPAVRRRRPDARLRVVGRVAERARGPWPEGAEPVGFVADRPGNTPAPRRCWRRSASAAASRSSWSRAWPRACPASPPRPGPRASSPCRPRSCASPGPPRTSPRRSPPRSTIPTRRRRGPRPGRRRRRTTLATPSPAGSPPTSTG